MEAPQYSLNEIEQMSQLMSLSLNKYVSLEEAEEALRGLDEWRKENGFD